MSTDGGKQSIEAIVQLVFDGRESEAFAALVLELGKPAEEDLRFSATVAGGEPHGDDKGRWDRLRLANLYRLSVFLTDRELWDKAVTALASTIKLSEDLDEPFFLEDCRFQKAFCHKMLGQRNEMLEEKGMISSNENFFIGDRVLRLRDLD